MTDKELILEMNKRTERLLGALESIEKTVASHNKCIIAIFAILDIKEMPKP